VRAEGRSPFPRAPGQQQGQMQPKREQAGVGAVGLQCLAVWEGTVQGADTNLGRV